MTRCLICDGADTACELNVRDYITGQIFALQRCPACGFMFTWPQPGNLDGFYPRSYRAYGPAILALFRVVHRRRVRSWTRARGAVGRALEIGCGHGWMLAALREAGWQTVGLERTVESGRHARTTLGLDVRIGELDVFGAGEQFDLIIMNQVLEHLADPMPRLRACAKLLKPGGWLIIGVPNLDSWQFHFVRQHWVHLDVPRHLGHFTRAALRAALKRAGLRMTEIRTTNFEYDPFGWPQAILNALGVEQNLLLSWLTGQKRNRLYTPVGWMAVLLTVLLAVPSLLLSVASWLAGAGAIMEVRAVRSD